MPSPQRVDQNDDVILARDCVVLEKRSTDGGPDAEQLEGSNADPVAPHALRLIRRAQVHRRARDERDALKRARVGRPIDQAGWVHVELPAVRGAEMLDDQREAVRLRERQGTVEQGVDDREDGGIGADADREREDGDGGEPGAPAQRAHGIAEVSEHRVYHYSTRKAASASNRAARRAGMSAATIAHAVNTTSAVPIAIGSAGCTSCN